MSEQSSVGSEDESSVLRAHSIKLKPRSSGGSPGDSPNMSPRDSPRNSPLLFRKLMMNRSIALQRRFTLAHTPSFRLSPYAPHPQAHETSVSPNVISAPEGNVRCQNKPVLLNRVVSPPGIPRSRCCRTVVGEKKPEHLATEDRGWKQCRDPRHPREESHYGTRVRLLYFLLKHSASGACLPHGFGRDQKPRAAQLGLLGSMRATFYGQHVIPYPVDFRQRSCSPAHSGAVSFGVAFELDGMPPADFTVARDG
ncbi:cAMP-specific 3',5'-cyclic phosphodiesterase 4C isoform X1 [Arapaima gigas]